MLHLGHLTVTALTLEEEVAHVRRALGVVMPFDGAHPLMGTHNHLMRLGEGVFLEVIAPDFDVTPKRRRWFALDDAAMRNSLERSPAARNLAIRAADLRLALAQIPGAAGESVCVTRAHYPGGFRCLPTDRCRRVVRSPP
jgi:hypothetical protein